MADRGKQPWTVLKNRNRGEPSYDLTERNLFCYGWGLQPTQSKQPAQTFNFLNSVWAILNVGNFESIISIRLLIFSSVNYSYGQLQSVIFVQIQLDHAMNLPEQIFHALDPCKQLAW